MYRLLTIAALLAAPTSLFAEVPPLNAKQLEEQAATIVTGTIAEIKASEPQNTNAGTQTYYDITLTVTTIAKGKLPDVKSIVVRGHSHQLKQGFVGSSGHRDNATGKNIRTLAKGDTIKVFLGEPSKENLYPILFPNGFEVVTPTKK